MARKKYTPQYRPIYVQCATAHPEKLILYCQPLESLPRSRSQVNNQYNLQDTNHNGIISEKARKRIEIALQWLLYISKPKKVFCADTGKRFTFKINFITLTLPVAQFHSDEEIKQTCLKNFLDRISKTYNVKNYLWRAEAQANGNIHFHITTDTYIHYRQIQAIWNASVELLGYISAFEKKWKHREPNSTDVHSVKHVKKIVSYLSKYLCKDRAFSCIGDLRMIDGQCREVLYNSAEYRAEEGDKKKGKLIGHVLGARIRSISGRLWYCSRALSGMKGIKISEEDFNFKSISELCLSGSLKEHRADHAVLYFGDVVSAAKKYSPELHSLFLSRS